MSNSALTGKATDRVFGKYLAVEFTTDSAVNGSSWRIDIATVINGDWTAYGDWDTCSGTCMLNANVISYTQGTQAHYRNCTNPAPLNGGAFCSGNDFETRTCNAACALLDASKNVENIIVLPANYVNGMRNRWFLNSSSRVDVGAYDLAFPTNAMTEVNGFVSQHFF